MTRRANGEGHLKQTDSGWRVQIRIGPGKRIDVKGGKTKKEARKTLEEIQKKHHLNIDKNIFFKEWLDAWMRRHISSKAEGTRVLYKSLIEKHVKPHLGEIKLSDLRSAHFQEMVHQLSKKLSSKSIKTILAMLNSCLNQAVKSEILFRNVITTVEKPRVDPLDYRILTKDEFIAFYKESLSSRYKLTFLLMLFGGLRKGEALGVSWESINLEKGTVEVKKQLTIAGNKIKLGPLKSPSSYRTIVLPDVAIEEFKKVPKYQRSGLLYSQELKNPRKLGYSFNKIKEKIGIPKITPHGLRHTYSSLLLNEKEPITNVSKLLGHSSTDITGKVYAHKVPGSDASAASKLDQLVTKKGENNE